MIASPTSNPRFRHWCLNTHPKELGALVKWLFHTKRIETSIESNGLRLWLDPISKLAESLDQGRYEPILEDWLKKSISPSGAFMDIGANEGYFSMYVMSTLKAGRVICVEPNPALWPVILRNGQLNFCGSFALVPFAIGNAIGNGTFVVQPSTNSGASSLCQRPSLLDRFRKHITVTTVTMDWIIKANGLFDVDAVKIDVEGYEEEAIGGARNSLRKRVIKSIAIELHNTLERTAENAASTIRELMAGFSYVEHVTESPRWIFFERPAK